MLRHTKILLTVALSLMLAAVTGAAVACDDNSAVTNITGVLSANSAGIFFPVQKSGFDQMLAELHGEVVLDNGYLRVADYLLIWPYGFSLHTEGEEIQVIDGNGQVVGRVGDQIDVGGGESTVEIVEKYIGQLLPDDCVGPYWIVSVVVND
jgi:hypothetical protein